MILCSLSVMMEVFDTQRGTAESHAFVVATVDDMTAVRDGYLFNGFSFVLPEPAGFDVARRASYLHERHDAWSPADHESRRTLLCCICNGCGSQRCRWAC